jgi:hypothetical protein
LRSPGNLPLSLSLSLPLSPSLSLPLPLSLSLSLSPGRRETATEPSIDFSSLFRDNLLVGDQNGDLVCQAGDYSYVSKLEKSLIAKLKSKIENRKSKIENRKSKIENRKSKIENRKPKIER